jgi:hypothetical protein
MLTRTSAAKLFLDGHRILNSRYNLFLEQGTWGLPRGLIEYHSEVDPLQIASLNSAA